VIALSPGARVWLACGATGLRRGMPGLVPRLPHGLGRGPQAGDLLVVPVRRGSLLKILWHDGAGLSLREAAKDGALRLADAEGGRGGDLRSLPGLVGRV